MNTGHLNNMFTKRCANRATDRSVREMVWDDLFFKFYLKELRDSCFENLSKIP